MPGKYDPPDKARLLADNPRISSTVELAVAAAEAQFSPKVKAEGDASRARPLDETISVHAPAQMRAVSYPNLMRGRRPVVTPERMDLICAMLAEGDTERSACLRAGIGMTAWNVAKRSNNDLRIRIAKARDAWASLRHQRHAAARYESQTARAAGRKALKPTPTKQANLVTWYLIRRVDLNFAMIPEEWIKKACDEFSMSFDQWRRQENAFGLFKKVYAKRAAIRGEQPQFLRSPFEDSEQDWQPNEDDDCGYEL